MSKQQLMRLTVMEGRGGACLFDRTWAWHSSDPSHAGSADGICSLVLALAKLSRDVCAASSSDVGSALFDPSALIGGGGAIDDGLRRDSRSAAAAAEGRVRLAYVRRERVVLAAFHGDDGAAPTAAAVAAFLAAAGARFEAAFGAAIDALRPRFEAIERSDGQLSLTPEELQPFAAFAEVAEALRAEHGLHAAGH